jgi:hypothetical protein
MARQGRYQQPMPSKWHVEQDGDTLALQGARSAKLVAAVMAALVVGEPAKGKQRQGFIRATHCLRYATANHRWSRGDAWGSLREYLTCSPS